MSEQPYRYLIALGGNVRHHRYGPPEAVLAKALATLDDGEIAVLARSRIGQSAPIGPSRRRYANGAALIETGLEPPALLAHLQAIETAFGRRRRGARWGARTLDLDIVLWSGGSWADERLIVPHPLFRQRDFVLGPASEIAPAMRDPVTRLTIRQLCHRLRRQGA